MIPNDLMPNSIFQFKLSIEKQQLAFDETIPPFKKKKEERIGFVQVQVQDGWPVKSLDLVHWILWASRWLMRTKSRYRIEEVLSTLHYIDWVLVLNVPLCCKLMDNLVFKPINFIVFQNLNVSCFCFWNDRTWMAVMLPALALTTKKTVYTSLKVLYSLMAMWHSSWQRHLQCPSSSMPTTFVRVLRVFSSFLFTGLVQSVPSNYSRLIRKLNWCAAAGRSYSLWEWHSVRTSCPCRPSSRPSSRTFRRLSPKTKSRLSESN